MVTKLSLDKAGRIVIPKSLRRQLRLEPGDSLELESHDEWITLKPVRPAVGLKKEHGMWVYRSGQPQRLSAQELIDRDREKRIRELTE